MLFKNTNLMGLCIYGSAFFVGVFGFSTTISCHTGWHTAWIITPVFIAGIGLSLLLAKAMGQKIRNTSEELRKSNELYAKTNQELERFAYIASHDLKAPLRSIDNLAKWVIEDTKGILPPDAQEKLDLLRGRISRMEILLSDILAYSRAGRIVDDEIQVDAGELVNTVIQSHVPDSFKVTIIDPMPTFLSPRTPLEQIFGNILSNAVKHHDCDSGSIIIRALDKGDFYEFIISDDGPGIPPEFHEHVFEMFQTLQSKDHAEGSGMGMAIIKKLVEYRNCRVWIESYEGKRGTAIHFLWPKK